MTKLDIGIVGLSVMGRSLALNMADHGFKVGGYNRSAAVTQQVMRDHPHENLTPLSHFMTWRHLYPPSPLPEGSC